MKLINKLKLFTKLYFGIASENERKKVFDSKESTEMMSKEWVKSENKIQLSKAEKKEMYSHIQNDMFAQKSSKTTGKQFIIFMRKYAALILLALSLAVTVTYIITTNKASDRVVYVTKENNKGNRSGFLLPDGSKVWLNADSKLIYPEKFSQENREVNLIGEAYFEISEDKQKPFRVITEDVDIEVLGTVFNVEAYPGDNNIQTTLVSGKVAVSDNSKTVKRHRFIMSKGHMAIFNKKDREFTLDKVDVYLYTSWKDGKLIFDNATFSEIQKKLERIYDVKFVEGADILNKYHYTITITNESIDEIMQLIYKTTPIEYRIEGKYIYITEIKK